MARRIQQRIAETLKSPEKLSQALKPLEPEVSDIREQAIELIRNGCKPQTALRILGVNADTEKRWREVSKGSHAVAVEKWKFFRDLDVAKNRFKADLIAKIARNDDWKSAAWLLERQYRNEFGKEIKLTSNRLNAMSDEEIERALKQLDSKETPTDGDS